MACLTALCVAPLPSIKLETSNESYFHKSDPTLDHFTAFREQFGREERIIVAITPPRVFSRAFLEKLQAFHEALEERVPFVSEVVSLVNVRQIRGEGGTLIVEDLLKTLPASPAGLALLRERVLASRLYRNYLISEDGRTVAVLIEALAYSPGAGEQGWLAGFAEQAPAGAAPVPLTEGETQAVLEGVQAVIAGPEAADGKSGGLGWREKSPASHGASPRPPLKFPRPPDNPRRALAGATRAVRAAAPISRRGRSLGHGDGGVLNQNSFVVASILPRTEKGWG